MTERIFTRIQGDFIKCDTDCNEVFTGEIDKQIKGVEGTVSKRCAAPFSSQRGQNFALPEGHETNLAACRVCVLHTNTTFDKPAAQA